VVASRIVGLHVRARGTLDGTVSVVAAPLEIDVTAITHGTATQAKNNDKQPWADRAIQDPRSNSPTPPQRYRPSGTGLERTAAPNGPLDRAKALLSVHVPGRSQASIR